MQGESIKMRGFDSFRAAAWIAILLAGVLAHGACPAKLYVALDGQSGWSGSPAQANRDRTDGPLPSLEAARDRIRELRVEGCHSGVHVEVRGGIYRLDRPFELSPEDSGTMAEPVVYEAYPGERPVLSGGRVITGWSKNGRGEWCASNKEPMTQLFVNGARAQRVRAPYDGYFRAEGTVTPEWFSGRADGVPYDGYVAADAEKPQEERYLLHYRGNDIKPEWAGSGAEVVVLLAWAEMRRPILAVDAAQHVAILAGPATKSTHEGNARYWVDNIPTGSLGNGEWRHDEAKGEICYKPALWNQASDFEFVAPRLPQLAIFRGDASHRNPVHDIELRGLTFHDSAWILPDKGFADNQAAPAADAAIVATDALRISFEGCTFHALGGYAIHLREGSRENRIEHSNFYDLGAGAVHVGEKTVPLSDDARVRDNAVDDNEIHSIGIVYPSAVAVWIQQSGGNSVAHNHMYDLPYSAVSVGWTWGSGPSAADHNRIEFNSIHDAGTVLSDLGGIYLLGKQPGTVVRNNLIHDVHCFTYGGWGIYLDEGSSGMVVENNVVYRTQTSGFHQNYGSDNLVRNNIFAFGYNFQLMRGRGSFHFDHNIVIYDSGALLAHNWSRGDYEMDNNLYWDMRGTAPRFGADTWDDWHKKGNDVHSQIADPKFANPLNDDFRLSTDSPAPGMGIHAIDLRGVGPRPWNPASNAGPVTPRLLPPVPDKSVATN